MSNTKTIVIDNTSPETQGEILYFNGTTWTRLSAGQDGYALITHGSSSDPTWEAVAAGAAGGDLTGTYPNPTIASGVIDNDNINASADIDVSKLASGDDGYILTSNSGTPVWQPPEFSDNDFRILDNSDTSKAVAFEASNITASTTRTITVPDSDITLDDANDSRPPNGSAGGALTGSYPNPELASLTLSDLNTLVSDATLDDSSSSRPPSGSAGGDLGGTYPNPTVNDLTITSEAQGSTLYFDGLNWVQLSAGDDGYTLKANGAGSNPEWEKKATGNVFVWRPGYTGNSPNIHTTFTAAYNAAIALDAFSTIVLDGYDSTTFTMPDGYFDGQSKIFIQCTKDSQAYTITFNTNTTLLNFLGFEGNGSDGIANITASAAGPAACYFLVTNSSIDFKIRGYFIFSNVSNTKSFVRFNGDSGYRVSIGNGNAATAWLIRSDNNITVELLPSSNITTGLVQGSTGTLTVRSHERFGLSSVVGSAWGGTLTESPYFSFNSQANGDLTYYSSSSGRWVRLPSGNDGYQLTSISSIPTWVPQSYATLIYQPGGVAAGNTYTSITNLQTAINNIYNNGGYGEVIFDGSQNNRTITLTDITDFKNVFGIRCVNFDSILFNTGSSMYNCRYFKSDSQIRIETIGTSPTRPFYFTNTGLNQNYIPYFENIRFFSNSTTDRELITLSDGTYVSEIDVKDVFAQSDSDNILSVFVINDPYVILNCYGDNTCIAQNNLLLIGDSDASSPLFLTINNYGDNIPAGVSGWNNTGAHYVVNNLGRSGAPRRNLVKNTNTVAVYNFDKTGEEHGDVDALDLSFSATPIYYPGHFKNSWSFAPSIIDGYAFNSNAALNITAAITIEAVVYLPATPAGNRWIYIRSGDLASETEADNATAAMYIDTNLAIRYYHESGAGTNTFIGSSNGVVPVGEWCHLAIVRQSNGLDLEFFVNGISSGTATAGSAPTGGTNGMAHIGAHIDGNEKFPGYISSLRISNAALTPNEVLNSALASIGRNSISNFGAPKTLSVSIGTSQNNWTPGGNAASWDAADVLLLTLTGSMSVTGFTAPLTTSSPHIKRVIKLDGSFTITLSNESASSTTTNRIRVHSSVDVIGTEANSGFIMEYNRFENRWRVISVIGGA